MTSEQAKILVIDDDESILKVLAQVLGERGYFVDTARTGSEAIDKSHKNFYNLALVDIRLPDMDGVDLLTGLKDSVPKMIKIIVTGYPSLENAVKAVNRGADGYLVKPLDMDKVLYMVREKLEKQRESEEYSEHRVAEFIETRARELETHRQS
jgi:two-component system response regulator GlrR